MTRGKHIFYFILFLIVVIFIIPGLYVSYKASDPIFCMSCHYERPYYDSWKESTHSDVACIECHPNLRTRLPIIFLKHNFGYFQMKPNATVTSEACLKCHEEEKLYQENVSVVDKKSFSHKKHMSGPLRGITLRCSSCHSHIVQGSHNVVEETVCFNCHFKGASPTDSITGCESCHGTPTETVEHEGFSFSHQKYLKYGVSCGECHIRITEGTGKLVVGACHKCHVDDGKDHTKEEIHEIHTVNNGVDCFECHNNIKHGNLEMVRTFDTRCDSCHTSLHSPQKSMYMGTGGKGIGHYPSRMFAAQVTCDGCHTNEKGTSDTFSSQTTKYQSPAACVTCHQEGFDRLLKDWQRDFKTMTAYMEERISQAKKSYSSGTPENKEIIETARYNLDMIETGKGAHNVEYGIKLMKYSLDQFDTFSEKPISSRPVALRTEDAHCATMCHNQLGMPENLLFEDSIDFPHPDHMKMKGVSCKQCHSTEHHGETTLTLEACNTCHHQELDNVEDRCTNCHADVQDFMAGSLKDADDGDADYMDGEVGCTECHDVTSGDEITVESISEMCGECHDEDYPDMLTEWVDTGTERRNTLNTQLTELETLAEGKTLSKVDATLVAKEFKEFKAVVGIFKGSIYLHNPEYGDTLYDRSQELYESLKTKLQ